MNMMEDMVVKSDIYNIRFVSNCEWIREYIKQHLDDFNRLTINTHIVDEDDNFDMTFKYINCDAYKIKYTKKTKEMVLYSPWSKISKSTIIPMMFRIMVELLRQGSDEIKLHASAVEKDNKVALLLAPSEGGKTTTALSLCQNYNYIMRANDASVVKFISEVPVFLRGDSSFRFRLNSLETYSKSFYDLATKNHIKKELPWYDKLKMDPNDLNISINDQETTIKHIFFVKLDSHVNGCTIKKYGLNEDERRDFWLKYKMQILTNIGGTIKGNDLIPIGNDGTILPIIIPDFDNSIYAKKRIKFINDLFDKCEVYQIRGKLDNVVEFINNKVQNG